MLVIFIDIIMLVGTGILIKKYNTTQSLLSFTLHLFIIFINGKGK